ncbi:MAG: lanthionine synthetase LanC family protein [Steroidobacteraceae bacterium]
MSEDERCVIEAAVARILRALNSHRFSGNSLLGGRMGRALLNANAIDSKIFDSPKLQRTFHSDLDQITEFSSYDNASYSTGIAGCLWFLSHLDRLRHIDKDEFIDNEVHDCFLRQAIQLLDQGNCDPMHGAIGYALFALEMCKLEQTQLLHTFIERLRDIAIIDEAGARWRSIPASPGHEMDSTINMGMAHGQAGIVAFLLKCRRRGIQTSILNTLLHQSTQFIMHTHVDFSRPDIPVKIPAAIINGKYNVGRKLAWCYGDLSSAYTAYRAASLLKIADWKEKSLVILNGCASDEYVESYPMKDASFCHGTAGTSYVFGKLFKETGSSEFKRASEKWLAATLDFGDRGGRSAGFIYFNGKRMESNFGLLEGISGIGLVLLAHLRKFEPESTCWDGCFYLN